MDNIEEEKKGDDSPKFLSNTPTHSFTDNLVTITPIDLESTHSKERSCYQFVIVPKQGKRRFLP
jgi:hypothetical protein